MMFRPQADDAWQLSVKESYKLAYLKLSITSSWGWLQPQIQNRKRNVKGTREVQGVPQSQVTASPFHQEERHKPSRAKQTNAQKAHIPALFPKRGNRDTTRTEEHKDNAQDNT